MCAGDKGKVFASNTSIVGSIGVITAQFGAVEALKKLGLERRVYTAGTSKAMLDPFRPVTDEQEATLRSLLEGMHGSFRKLVKESRQDALKVTDNDLFSGRVWTGAQAAELGIVDGTADMKSKMREEFGDKTAFVLCSDKPGGGIFDMFGFRRSVTAGPSAGGASGWPSPGEAAAACMEQKWGPYIMAQQGLEGVLDELEHRAAWAPYILRS